MSISTYTKELELMPLVVNRVTNVFPLFRDAKKGTDIIYIPEYFKWDGCGEFNPEIARIPFESGTIILGEDSFVFQAIDSEKDETDDMVQVIWYHRIQSAMCPICTIVGNPSASPDNNSDNRNFIAGTDITKGLSFLDLTTEKYCNRKNLWMSARELGMSYQTFEKCMSKSSSQEVVNHKTFKLCLKAFSYFTSCIIYINLQIEAERRAKQAAIAGSRGAERAKSPKHTTQSNASSSNRKIVIGNVKIDVAEGSGLTRTKIMERKCTCWSVRGHKRHYKNGRVVWIKPYKKGRDRLLGSIEPKMYDIQTQKGL